MDNYTNTQVMEFNDHRYDVSNKLTIYFPYYNQREALLFQLNNMLKYSKKIREKLYILIVDDGSQVLLLRK